MAQFNSLENLRVLKENSTRKVFDFQDEIKKLTFSCLNKINKSQRACSGEQKRFFMFCAHKKRDWKAAAPTRDMKQFRSAAAVAAFWSIERSFLRRLRNNQFIVLITHIFCAANICIQQSTASICIVVFMLQCAKYGNFYGTSSN